MPTYSRSDIAERVGLPLDVVAHWTKERLLIPETKGEGRGRHHRYSKDQLNKAAIMARLREFGCAIHSLRWFNDIIERSYHLRDCYPEFESVKFWMLHGMARDLRNFEAGLEVKYFDPKAGERRPVKSLDEILSAEWRDLGARDIDQLKPIVQKHANDRDVLALRIVKDLDDESIYDGNVHQIWLTWPTADGWDIYSDSDENISGLSLADRFPQAAIFLHISTILRALWGAKIPRAD